MEEIDWIAFKQWKNETGKEFPNNLGALIIYFKERRGIQFVEDMLEIIQNDDLGVQMLEKNGIRNANDLAFFASEHR